jgi:two-component system, NarL family, response regulator YdfI
VSRSPLPVFTTRPRLLVLWSQRLAGEALCSALRLSGFDVSEPNPGQRDAFEAVGERRPDMIILDIDQPTEVWNSTVLPVLEAFSSVKVLAVTGRTDSLAPRSAAAAGLQGCLRKDSPLSQVVEAIEAAMHGDTIFPRRSPAHVQRDPTATDEERLGALLAMQITPRERDVLELLTEGTPMDEIAGRLSITRNTVRTYLNSVFTKLQVHTRYQAVAAAVRYGVVRASGQMRR